MGGGGDKRYERNQLESERNRTNQDYGNFQSTINRDRDQRVSQANTTRDSISRGYTDFAETGGLRPEDEARIRAIYNGGGSGGSGGSGGGGGGASAPSSSAAGGVSFGGNAASGINIPRESALGGVGTLGPSNYENVQTPTGSAVGGVEAGNVRSALGGVRLPQGSNADYIPGLNEPPQPPRNGGPRGGYSTQPYSNQGETQSLNPGPREGGLIAGGQRVTGGQDPLPQPPRNSNGGGEQGGPPPNWNPPGTGGNGRGQFAAQQAAAQLAPQQPQPIPPGQGGPRLQPVGDQPQTQPGRSRLNDVTVGTGSAADDVQGPGASNFGGINTDYTSEAGGVRLPNGSNVDAVGGLNFDESNAGYRDMARTGGVRQDKIDAANDQFNPLTGANGGFQQGDIDAVRTARDKMLNRDNSVKALGGLDELGRTGGITPDVRSGVQRDYLKQTEQDGGLRGEDISRIRAKAARNAPGMFGAVKDQLDQARAVGGGTAGMSSTNFKLARQAAQQQNQDKQDAEIGLAESIRSGRLDASKTLSQNEMGLLEQGNTTKLGALGKGGDLELGGLAEDRMAKGGAAEVGLGMQGQIDSTRLDAMKGKQAGTLEGEGLIQKGKATGLGGLSDNEKTKGMFDLDKAKAKDTSNQENSRLGLTQAEIRDRASQSGIDNRLRQAAGLDSSAQANSNFGLDRARTQDAARLEQTNLNIQRAAGIDQADARRIDQLLTQADSRDRNAVNQANLELQRATGMDSAAFNNVSQQLQRAAGIDAATASNTMLALTRAQGLDGAAKDRLMAEIARASGMDEFTLGAVNAEISRASVSNQYNLGVGGLQLQQAGMQDSWNLNQQSLAQSAANASAAGGRANADDQFRMEQYLLEARNNGRLAGLGGLGDLRGSVPGEQLAYDQLWQGSIGDRAGAQQGNRSLSIQNNAANPGFGRQLVGALGGVAAGAASGWAGTWGGG